MSVAVAAASSFFFVAFGIRWRSADRQTHRQTHRQTIAVLESAVSAQRLTSLTSSKKTADKKRLKSCPGLGTH